jgi:hypothetical protein
MRYAGKQHHLMNTLVLAVIILLAATVPQVHAANLRIIMVDGTSLEVPYCWEEAGQIKFELAGGTAGIPRSSVASIQEIVTAGEFAPDVMVKSTASARATDKSKAIETIVEKQLPTKATYRTLTQEEIAQLMAARPQAELKDTTKELRIHSATVSQQADLTDLAQVQGNGAVLVMKQIMSTRDNVRTKRFTLNLYDAQGSIIERRPCEIVELSVDKKTLRQLGISGSLFSVMAVVRPDAKIKRYEITSQ